MASEEGLVRRRLNGRRMPKRPQQHVTESASKRAFERRLPKEWVYREQVEDYGIDGEVEIFSEGQATGLIFKVQLKGTDQEDPPISVRLTKDKVNYYSSLPLPVLVVLHHRRADRVFARWVQSWDPAEETSTENSITMRFPDESELAAESVRNLARDVEVHRRLLDPNGALPMELVPERLAESLGDVATAPVALALRDAARPFPDILRLLPRNATTAMGTIQIRNDRIVVSCRGLMSATMHYPEAHDTPVDVITANVMMQIGVLLERIGQSAAAARLFARFASDSSIIEHSDILLKMARAFGRAHRLGDAIETANQMIARGEADTAHLLISLTWTVLGAAITPSEREAIVEHFMSRIRRAEEIGDDRRAAIEYFNFANRLRNLGDSEQAVDCFRKAAELDPTYPDREYYAGELAGALFEAGDFDGAVAMYAKAVEHGERARFLPLLADALLMAGRYADAQRAFEQRRAENDMSPEPAEWRLKERLANRLRTLVGDAQDRNPDVANRLADVSSEALTDQQRRTQLLSALATDALCPLAWFNLGWLEANEGHERDALDAFTYAGVISRMDLEAWTLATILSIDQGSGDADDVVRAAYFIKGSNFIRYLTERTSKPDLRSAQSRVLESVEAILSSGQILAPEAEALRLRFIDDEGEYESLDIGI